MAERVAELSRSSFSYEHAARTLHFIGSGDRVALIDVQRVAWTVKGGIPASDVNRCWFMSFAEQATFLSGNPETDITELCHYVRQLTEAAPLVSSILPIPWQPLSAARRIINLLAALSLLLRADPLLAVSEEASFLIDHLFLLNRVATYLREDDLGYNHLATELFAQTLFACVGVEEDRFHRAASNFLIAVEQQVGPDGLQKERSATYQAHVLGHVEVLIAGDILSEPLKEQALRLASRMKNALAIMSHPDGGIAVFKDSAVGDGPSPASLGALQKVWPEGRASLLDAGYARLNAGNFTVLFNAGECGPRDNPGHAHADFLSLELSVGNQRLIVDPGVKTYKAGPERDWTRSAATHNGPTFAGKEPIEFIGAFRVGRRGRAFFFTNQAIAATSGASVSVSGWQNGFDLLGGRVARWLGFYPSGSLVIVDAWQGRSDLEAVSTFLIPAHWGLKSFTPALVELEHTETGELVLLSALQGALDIGLPTFCFPFGPRKAVPAIQIHLRPKAAAESRTASLLVQSAGSRPSYDSLIHSQVASITSSLHNAMSRESPPFRRQY